MIYKEQLNKLLNDIPLKCISKHIKAFYQDLYQEVIHQTQFLNNPKFTERIYVYLNDISYYPLCPICKQGKLKFINFIQGYTKYCSRKCGNYNDLIQQNREQTFLQKYGVKNPCNIKGVKEKIKQTNNKKYGGNAPLCSKRIQSKIKQTNLERYGVEYASQNQEVKKKTIQTKNNKTIKENQKINQKRQKTIIAKYGNSKYLSKINLKNQYYKLKEKIKNNFELLFTEEKYYGTNVEPYLFKCKKCGNEFLRSIDNGRKIICRNCNPVEISKSSYEKELYAFIKELGIQCYTSNRKIIYPLELDIYIPKKNIAIEIDGLYWHSEAQGKDKNYHLNKTNLCEKQDIQLIHIFEDELLYWSKEMYNKGA